MSVTLPVDFVVTPGSLEAGVAKATEAVQAAAKAQADAQAKALAYVDGLRAKAFAADQRGREAAERAEEKQAAYLASLKQKYFAAEQQRRDQETAGLAKWKASLDAVALSVSGVSSEEQRLLAIQEQTTGLYNAGQISAKEYAAATDALARKTAMVKAAAAETAAGQASLKASLSQTGEGMAKVAAALSVVDPKLGALVASFQKVQGLSVATAGASDLVGLSFGTVAEVGGVLLLALAPIAATLYDIDHAQKAAAASAKVLKEAQDSSLPIYDAALDALRELKLKTSGLTDAQQAQAELARFWDRQLAGSNAKVREQLDLAQEKLDSMAANDSAYIAQYDLVKDLNSQLAENNRAAAIGLAAASQTLEYTTEQAGATAALTAETKANTQAVKDRGAAAARSLTLLLKAADQDAAAEKARAAAYDQAFEGLDKIHDAALKSIATTTEQIQLDAQAARESAARYAADAQAAAENSDQRKAIAIELRETLLLIGQQETRDMVAEQQKQVDAAVAAAEKEAKAKEESIIGALSAAQGGLSSIVSAIAGPVAGAITDMILNLDDTFAALEEQLLSLPKIIRSIPSLVSGLVEMLPAILEGIVAAIPDLILSLVAALPSIIYGIVELIPDVVLAVVEALPDIISGLVTMIPTVAVALVGAVVTELIPALPQIALGLVDALAAALYQTVLRLAAAFLDAIGFDDKAKDLRKTARTYGDTPGPVYMAHGGSADFGRGDWVAAARSRQELQRQAGGGQSSGWSAAPATVSYSDGHLGFDREMRRAIRQPRLFTEIFGFTAARKLA